MKISTKINQYGQTINQIRTDIRTEKDRQKTKIIEISIKISIRIAKHKHQNNTKPVKKRLETKYLPEMRKSNTKRIYRLKCIIKQQGNKTMLLDTPPVFETNIC